MKKIIILTLTIFAVVFAVYSTADGMNRSQYDAKYKLYGIDSRYAREASACLDSFPNHPFKYDKNLKFRVISPGVVILGSGVTITDKSKTNYSQFILIRPAVNVLSKVDYELLNPKGWYCFRAKVNVLGESTVKIACNAHITTATATATVMGKSEGEREGITVLGKSIVKRMCKEA